MATKTIFGGPREKCCSGWTDRQRHRERKKERKRDGKRKSEKEKERKREDGKSKSMFKHPKKLAHQEPFK